MAEPIGKAYAEVILNKQKFTADVRGAGAAFKSEGTRMTGTASKITSSLKGIVGAAAGLYALKRGISAALGEFVKFDTKLRNIWTLTDATWDSMQQLGDQAEKVAMQFGKTGSEALDALYQIYSASFQRAEGMKVLEASLVGAAAGLTSVKTAATVTTGILNSYSMAADKAMQVNDLLFKIVERGVTTYEQLGTSFGAVAAIAAPFGVRIEELAGAVMTLTRRSIPLDRVMTALTGSILAVAKPTKIAEEIISDLGYTSGMAMLKELGFAESIKVLMEEAERLGYVLTDVIENKRAMMAILPLAGEAAEEFAEDMQQAADATGSASVAFEKMKGPALELAKATARLKSAYKELGEVIAPLISLLGLLTEAVVGSIDYLKQWGSWLLTPVRYARILIDEGIEALIGAFESLTKTVEGDPFEKLDADIMSAAVNLKLLSQELGEIPKALEEITDKEGGVLEGLEDLSLSFRDLEGGPSFAVPSAPFFAAILKDLAEMMADAIGDAWADVQASLGDTDKLSAALEVLWGQIKEGSPTVQEMVAQVVEFGVKAGDNVEILAYLHDALQSEYNAIQTEITALEFLERAGIDVTEQLGELKSDADYLSDALGLTGEGLDLVTVAAREVATALELLVIAAGKMPTTISEYQAAFAEAEPGSYVQAQILGRLESFYRQLITAQDLLQEHSVPANAALTAMIASLEGMGFKVEEVTKRTDEATAAWAEDYERIFEIIKAGPAGVLPIVEQFLNAWQASDTGLMAAVDLLEMLRQKLEELSSARELVGISVDDLADDLKRLSVLLTTTVEEPEEREKRKLPPAFTGVYTLTAEVMEEYIDLLREKTSTVEEFVEQIRRTSEHLEDKPALLTLLHRALEEDMHQYEALIPVLRTFGYSTREAEYAAAYLASALGITEGAAMDLAGALGAAASAAMSLAASARAASISQMTNIIPQVDRMLAELRSGTVTEAPSPVSLTGPGFRGVTVQPAATERPLLAGEVYERQQEIFAVKGFVDSLREGSYRLGSCVGGVCYELDELSTYFGDVTSGMLPEEIAAQQEQAARAAEAEASRAARAADAAASSASRKAEAAAEKARREEEERKRKAAQAAEAAFRSQFIDPISKALETADWQIAADSIKRIAGQYPDLVAEAAALAKKHGLEIDHLEVMRLIVGMESDLLSVLKERVSLARLAGEFDLATSLQELLSEIEEGFAMPEPEKTWKEVASGILAKYDELMDAAIGALPQRFGAVFAGIYDVFKNALVDPLGAVTSALSLIAIIFDAIIGSLEDRKVELEKALDTYMHAFTSAASLVGGMLGSFIDLLVNTIKMATLEGLDLLNAGISALTSFVGSLISSFQSLISQSDAYKAVQKEAQAIWAAFANLLGTFLWPIAAALKYVIEALGIPTGGAEEAQRKASLNVPTGWKMERLRYAAIRPGEPVAEEEARVEIPAWAEPFGKALGESIMEILKQLGIDSWTSLMEAFKNAAVSVWSWISSRLPAFVRAVVTAVRRVGSVLADAGITLEGIVDWIKKGIDWFIANLPQIAENATRFLVKIFGVIGTVWNWIASNMPTWAELEHQWDRFIKELKKLQEMGSMSDMIKELAKIRAAIDALKRVFKIVMAIAAGAIIGGIGGALAPLTFGWSVGGAALGALAGGAIGGLIASMFDQGGVVPGPIGAPQMVLAHAGETILPTHKPGFNMGYKPIPVILQIDKRELGRAMIEWVSDEGYEMSGKTGTSMAWNRRVL